MKKIVLFILFLLSVNELAFCQNFTLPLWSNNIPNYQPTDEVEVHDSTDMVRISNVQQPNIAIYLPSKKNATGQAVVICPGGGYRGLAYDWEGSDIAKWLNSKGIAGIVLKYRLPVSKSNIINWQSPLLDAQRAIRMTRFFANDWNIDKNKIGILGSSAGGHLASTAATHLDEVLPKADDSTDFVSARPDFMILLYPVITFKQPAKHAGSEYEMLGDSPDSALVRHFSNELQVNDNTPPTFLVHAADDKVVPVENSLMFFQALKDNNVPAEMHIYPEGGHGFSLAIGKGHLESWIDNCERWLKYLNQP